MVCVCVGVRLSSFFFFNDTATTEIYTLSLHDALPILGVAFGGLADGVGHLSEAEVHRGGGVRDHARALSTPSPGWGDRKSTRLNSSHANISYAVFCLKKKKKHESRRIYVINQTTVPAS